MNPGAPLHSIGMDATVGTMPPVWVLDTNVVLDWLIFRDPSSLVIANWIETARAQLITREDCRAELGYVLDRSSLPGSVVQRAQALCHYDRLSSPITDGPGPTILPVCRDASDQKFLELARDGRATWLITKDKMLLRLASRARRLDLFGILSPTNATRLLREYDASF